MHHTDTIGMGNNRMTLDDSGHRKMMLSAYYHDLAHRIGQEAFEKQFGVFGVIYADNEKDPLEGE